MIFNAFRGLLKISKMSKKGKMFLLVISHWADKWKGVRLIWYVASLKHFWGQWRKKHEKEQKFLLDKSFLDRPMVWRVAKRLCLEAFRILCKNKKTTGVSYVTSELEVYYHSFCWYSVSTSKKIPPLPLRWISFWTADRNHNIYYLITTNMIAL